MSKGWDSLMLKKLKVLAGRGLSTSEIGRRLGVSKNAVVGKLNRLGWNPKAGGTPVYSNNKAKNKKIKPTTKTVKKPVISFGNIAKKKVKKAKIIAKKPAKLRIKKAKNAHPAKSKLSKKTLSKTLAMHQRIVQHSLEMANLKPNQCRWPIGDPDSENFHFCGQPVFVGKPYCYEHCKQAYQFIPPKKK